MSRNILNPDFVLAAIYMAAQYTPVNLEHIASVEWRDEEHLKPSIQQYISENNLESFELSWIQIKNQFKL